MRLISISTLFFSFCIRVNISNVYNPVHIHTYKHVDTWIVCVGAKNLKTKNAHLVFLCPQYFAINLKVKQSNFLYIRDF